MIPSGCPTIIDYINITGGVVFLSFTISPYRTHKAKAYFIV